MLIVLEGPDGAGKTTILNHLKNHFPDAIFTNPFDNDYGKLVKQVLNYEFLINYKYDDNETKYRIYKLELMKNVLCNAYTLLTEHIQSNKKLVIMDRWIPSFYCYQKPYYNKETSNFFSQYFDYHEGSFARPDFTFYLMPPKDIILDRLNSRESKDVLDHYFIDYIDSIIKDYNNYINMYDNNDYYEIVDTSLDNSQSLVVEKLKFYLSNRGNNNV